MHENKKNDQFADIAASGINDSGKGLFRRNPEELKARELPIRQEKQERRLCYFPPKMNSREELYRELSRWKKRYSPFLQKLSPDMPSFRQKMGLDNFKWRKETEEDRRNFQNVLNGCGNWETVSIPHYGGPLGVATTYYRTTFRLPDIRENQVVFVCFRGVDYKAHVFINGAYLGSHEGFFAKFEFDATGYVKPHEENTIVIRVENDFIMKRNQSQPQGQMFGGDKLYAATGPGFDDPVMGWHHCPPGMGIYQPVTVEIRPRIFINDIYIRPLPERSEAEAWIEVYQCGVGQTDVRFRLSLFGRNFERTVFKDLEYIPVTGCKVGLGDTYTEAMLKTSGKIGQAVPLCAEKGLNTFKIPFKIKNFRWWEPNRPYLYELQVQLAGADNTVLDTGGQSFGMRSFRMDTENAPKGSMFLNGRPIRLRGANTMGNGQQCVMKGDFDQLADDLLLAKICNMNFLRITQRPVQEEIYQYCDMLGVLVQTDLPLFGVLRRNQFSEALRQAEEMEKLVRKHPCCILDTYINEPFPNANNQPHRYLNREELMSFFDAADSVVKLNNPERVTKHADGDYDPPCKSLPDNHCYTAWYNGSGVDLGALHRGYWLPTKPDWNCGCGEYGAEGLDFISVMRKYYPAEWLPQSPEEEKTWSPNRIIGAQTGNFHGFFYETPGTLQEWIKRSQEHQAWATKWITESFRRNRYMVSSAIHLFIDAFPAGWMKAIMDVERSPKPAYFAYRDALTPAMVSLRTDRFGWFAGEKVSIEIWLCNDNPESEPVTLYYEVTENEMSLYSGEKKAEFPACSAVCCGFLAFQAPDREAVLNVQCAAVGESGKVIHTNSVRIKIGRKQSKEIRRKVLLAGKEGKAERLASELKLNAFDNWDLAGSDTVILLDDYKQYRAHKKGIDSLVSNGAKAVFLELEPGTYQLFTTNITVKPCGMLPLHFVSRDTGHFLVRGFDRTDFELWYDSSVGRITPILEQTFHADGMTPILTSVNTNRDGDWGKALAAAEKSYGKGKFLICELKLAGRTRENPAAELFAIRMIDE